MTPVSHSRDVNDTAPTTIRVNGAFRKPDGPPVSIGSATSEGMHHIRIFTGIVSWGAERQISKSIMRMRT